MLKDVNRRDRDFMRAMRREAVRSSGRGRPLTVREAVKRVAASPAPSFYLSTEYAWRVLCRPPRRIRRSRRAAMWEALRERFEAEVLAHPGEDPYSVLDRLLREQQAPGFFISEATAMSLYFKLINHGRNGSRSQ